uniref:UDENN FLCN/SMCR8-type domain-containing protein n=1 Tax=Steinernema glaseri TaxID=37863 RepID=A0A1I8AIQ4_9BILA
MTTSAEESSTQLDSLLDFPIVHREARVCDVQSVGKTSVGLSSWSRETTVSMATDFHSEAEDVRPTDNATRSVEFLPSDVLLSDTTQEVTKEATQSALSSSGTSSTDESTSEGSFTSETSGTSSSSCPSDCSKCSFYSTSTSSEGSGSSSSTSSGSSDSVTGQSVSSSIPSESWTNFFIGERSPLEAQNTLLRPTHFCLYQQEHQALMSRLPRDLLVLKLAALPHRVVHPTAPNVRSTRRQRHLKAPGALRQHLLVRQIHSIPSESWTNFFIGERSPLEAQNTLLRPTHFCLYQQAGTLVFCYLSYRGLFHHFAVRQSRLMSGGDEEAVLYFLFPHIQFYSISDMLSFYCDRIEAAQTTGVDAFSTLYEKFDHIEQRRLKKAK